MKQPKFVKTLVSFVTIMTFMSFMVGDFVYPLTDDTDNLPWYYKKDKTMDATRQGQANNLEIERRNAVEEDMKEPKPGREEIKAELKKKISGAEGNINIEGFEYDGSPIEEPLNIPQPILDFLNERNALDYRAVFSDGTYKIIWIEESGGKQGLFVKTFDFNGNGIVEGETCLTEGRAPGSITLEDPTELSTGNIALIWLEGENKDSMCTILVQLLDKDGKAIGNQHIAGDPTGNSTVSLASAFELSEGNFVVFWQEKTGGNSSLNMQAFNTQGVQKESEYEFTDNLFTDTYDRKGYKVTSLSNGGFAVSWLEEMNGTISLHVQMFSNEGTQLNEAILVTDFLAQEETFRDEKDLYKIVALITGGAALVWRGEDSGQNAIMLRIIGKNGQFTGNKHILVKNSYSSDSRIDDLVALDNGNIAVFYTKYLSKSQYYTTMQIFDGKGNTIGGEYYFGKDQDRQHSHFDRALTLANGNIVVFWKDYKNGGCRLMMQVFNKETGLGSGNFRISQHSWGLTDAKVQSIREMPNGTYILSWSEHGSGHEGWRDAFKIMLLSKEGQRLGNEYSLTGDTFAYNTYISGLHFMDNGKFALFWNMQTGSHDYLLGMQVFDESGNAIGNRFEFKDFHGMRISHVLKISEDRYAVIFCASGWGRYLRPKMYIFNADGTPAHAGTLELTELYDVGADLKISVNPNNGNVTTFCVCDDTHGKLRLVVKTFNKDGQLLKGYTPSYYTRGIDLYDVVTFENGNIAAFWKEKNKTDGSYSIKMQIFNADGQSLGSYLLTGTRKAVSAGLKNHQAFMLSNGNVAFLWDEKSQNKKSLRIQIFDQNGQKMNKDDLLSDEDINSDVFVYKATPLDEGKIDIVWSTRSGDQQELSRKIFTKTGESEDWKPIIPPSDDDKKGETRRIIDNPFIYPWHRVSERSAPEKSDSLKKNLKSDMTGGFTPFFDSAGRKPGKKPLTIDLRSYLLNNNMDEASLSDSTLNTDILSLRQRMLRIIKNRNIDSVLVTKKIMEEPTEEEEELLDAAEKLQEDLEETGVSGLNQASDDFIRVVANVLLAQALPGLLTEENMINIKALFEKFNEEKADIMEVYKEGVDLYYTSIKDDLIKNRAILKLKDIIANNLTEQRIEALGRADVDKLTDKIDSSGDKDMEFIKEKITEYRGKYLEPAITNFTENMKFLLRSYTKSLLLALEGAGVAEAKERE